MILHNYAAHRSRSPILAHTSRLIEALCSSPLYHLASAPSLATTHLPLFRVTLFTIPYSNMSVAIDITPMEVDLDSSSSARSDSGQSEVTLPSSIDECSPPDPPIKKAHNYTSPFAKYLKREHEGVFELQEAVATTLFNTSPDMLMSFVDPMVGTFKATLKSDKQLVIWRKGNAGFVSVHCTAFLVVAVTDYLQIGVFEHHTSMKKYGFEHLVGFSIGWDGSWRIIVGAGNAFCESKWPVVWSGPYEGLGGIHEMVVDKESMHEAKGVRAAKLAMAMMQGKFWNATVDLKAT
jgi:hypothetical protein